MSLSEGGIEARFFALSGQFRLENNLTVALALEGTF
jgi:hypothetical protein